LEPAVHNGFGKAGDDGGLLNAIVLADKEFADRNPGLTHGVAEGLCQGFALVVQILQARVPPGQPFFKSRHTSLKRHAFFSNRHAALGIVGA
jgi:hypothetical protein